MSSLEGSESIETSLSIADWFDFRERLTILAADKLRHYRDENTMLPMIFTYPEDVDDVWINETPPRTCTIVTDDPLPSIPEEDYNVVLSKSIRTLKWYVDVSSPMKEGEYMSTSIFLGRKGKGAPLRLHMIVSPRKLRKKISS